MLLVLIDFCCRLADSFFIIILYNITDPGETQGLEDTERELFELESPRGVRFYITLPYFSHHTMK